MMTSEADGGRMGGGDEGMSMNMSIRFRVRFRPRFQNLRFHWNAVDDYELFELFSPSLIPLRTI